MNAFRQKDLVSTLSQWNEESHTFILPVYDRLLPQLLGVLRAWFWYDCRARSRTGRLTFAGQSRRVCPPLFCAITIICKEILVACSFRSIDYASYDYASFFLIEGNSSHSGVAWVRSSNRPLMSSDFESSRCYRPWRNHEQWSRRFASTKRPITNTGYGVGIYTLWDGMEFTEYGLVIKFELPRWSRGVRRGQFRNRRTFHFHNSWGETSWTLLFISSFQTLVATETVMHIAHVSCNLKRKPIGILGAVEVGEFSRWSLLFLSVWLTAIRIIPRCWKRALYRHCAVIRGRWQRKRHTR